MCKWEGYNKTECVKHVATICGISERTVFWYERKWREEGEFSERKVGSGARWLLDDEEM